ncbi:hypothetical protein BGX33_006187 [Mortierella sp. NVP41]|nr:hypothetical protein BGX33_006187 [Mortierella sp. NVP41]
MTNNKKSSSTQPHVNIQPKQASAVEVPDYKYCTTYPQQELDGLQALVDQLVSTNSPSAKSDILAQHPDQAPLLGWIYDPLRQFYVRPTHIIKYAQRWAKQRDEALAAGKTTPPTVSTNDSQVGKSTSEIGAGSLPTMMDHSLDEKTAKLRADQLGRHGFDTLSALLGALSSRSISGHTSLDAVLLFMDRFCGPDPGSSFAAIDSSSPAGSYSCAMESLLSTPRSRLLLKILDKNLKTGCSVGLIREVYPTLIPGFHVALGKALLQLEDARELFEKKVKPSLEKKQKTIKKSSDPPLSPPKSPSPAPGADVVHTEWFGSRKLDGVRCLVRIDRQTGEIATLSRSGREFEGLKQLQGSFRSLLKMGQDDDDRGRDQFFRQALGLPSSQDDGSVLPEALILDGEMCVFITEPIQGATSSNSSDSSVIVGLPDEDGLGREKFTKAITFATRGVVEDEFVEGGANKDDAFPLNEPEAASGDGTEGMEYDRPIYCIFDCLTDMEFKDRTSTRLFADRIQGVTRALTQAQSAQDGGGGFVKVLAQTGIGSYEQLQKIVARGVERGWEGVMLRKNVGYEGKRSRNLLKVKQFQEAEFTVVEAMRGSMRLALGGEFEERDGLLANVVVIHRGNRVRVGSGFSVEERIRFGKDPSLIVGKTITVQYFAESSSKDSVVGGGTAKSSSSSIVQGNEDEGDGGDAVWSLRFPTFKAIYGEGPRTT